eukprot:PhF_6_TR10192/c2_g1_i3/m.15804
MKLSLPCLFVIDFVLFFSLSLSLSSCFSFSKRFCFLCSSTEEKTTYTLIENLSVISQQPNSTLIFQNTFHISIAIQTHTCLTGLHLSCLYLSCVRWIVGA